MSMRTAPDWLTGWEYAHRGLHSPGVPENSLAAAEAAIAAGMGIECDVQLSADGIPMVFHDWELDRLTEGQGATEAHDADTLARLCLLGTDQNPVPLSRFIEVVGGRVPLLIEIKSRPEYNVTKTCAQVQEVLSGYSGDACVMSFDPRVGGWFFQHSPNRVRGLVCTDTLDHGWLSAWRAPGALDHSNPHFLAMDIRDLPNAVCSLWRELGRPLLSWTIRSSDLRGKALCEVDALISEGEGLA